MIHELLNLTRPLIVLDVESTGTAPETDRIVEIGFQIWYPLDSGKSMVEWRSYINPGVPIPQSATDTHHITNEMMTACRRCGKPNLDLDHAKDGACEFQGIPSFAQVAARLASGFVNCDYAGKHVRFDLQITAAEMRRARVAWNYINARIIDAERLEQLAIPRSLSDLHEKYTGQKHDGAHGALSDVRASTTVIVRQLQEHPILPRSLDALHALQWRGWIDTEGKFRFVNGVPTILFGKHRHKPMKDVPVDYWDWLLKPTSDFSDDVKALAADAKLGKFPHE